jgi:RHS repeat-associated protein
MNQRPSLYRPEFSTTGFDGLHFAERSYAQMPSPWVADDEAARTLGLKAYELANHLGNVLTTVSDRRVAVPNAGNPSLLDSYMADVRSVSDYYPFGSLLPGRNYNSGSYRHLFQGQEHDDEINDAVGTSYAYTFRMHDPRIGRFLSIDPLAAKYPYWTPYAFSGNMVIQYRELEGLEPSIDMRANRAAALSMSPQEAIHHVQMMDEGDDIATNMVSRNGPLMTDLLLTGAAYATGGASAAIPVMLTILTGVPVTPSPAALEAAAPAAAWNGVETMEVQVARAAAATERATVAPVQPVLTTEQAANLQRFNKSMGNRSLGTSVDELGDGVMFTAEVPGRVPGSKAVYQKAVDATGQTTRFLKTTVTPRGIVAHIKDKMTGQQIDPLTGDVLGGP